MTATSTAPKTGPLLIGAVHDHIAVWVFCLASGGLSGIMWTPFERKVFLWDTPGLPLAPPGAWVPPAPVWGHGRSPLFPFLTWSWIPPSSSDFGSCPENHLASISQVYLFAVAQWGLLRLLGESAPAPEVTGWTTVFVHVASTFLEMRSIKYVLSGGLLFLFSLQLLRLRYRSVALLQGVPLHKATKRVLTVLSEPMELAPFQVVYLHLRHSPCRA
jgi:hypothetical protein